MDFFKKRPRSTSQSQSQPQPNSLPSSPQNQQQSQAQAQNFEMHKSSTFSDLASATSAVVNRHQLMKAAASLSGENLPTPQLVLDSNSPLRRNASQKTAPTPSNPTTATSVSDSPPPKRLSAIDNSPQVDDDLSLSDSSVSAPKHSSPLPPGSAPSSLPREASGPASAPAGIPIQPFSNSALPASNADRRVSLARPSSIRSLSEASASSKQGKKNKSRSSSPANPAAPAAAGKKKPHIARAISSGLTRVATAAASVSGEKEPGLKPLPSGSALAALGHVSMISAVGGITSPVHQNLVNSSISTATLARTPSINRPSTSSTRSASVSQSLRGRTKSPSDASVANSFLDMSYTSRYSSDDDGLSFDEPQHISGFAVASTKRNNDFHALFPSVPSDDYLIEDYGCALQREIICQGRLYISEHHISFSSNLFGWVTSLVIPFTDITSIDKKMTAYVIPNAISVTIGPTKHSFTSFLSRDTTIDVLTHVWKMQQLRSASPDAMLSDEELQMTPMPSAISGADSVSPDDADGRRPRTTTRRSGVFRKTPHRSTTCPPEHHFTETLIDCVVPGAPENLYNLFFTSGFIRDFMIKDQKLMEVEVGDWKPEAADSKVLSRSISYIKPLTGSFGPKQTRCNIVEETTHVDFDEFVSIISTTRTPEVPSGHLFSVKTRTTITWAGPVSSRVLVTSAMEWSGRSFIKSLVDKGAMDGQRTYYNALEKETRNYISKHASEFLGDEDAVAAAAQADDGAGGIESASEPKIVTFESPAISAKSSTVNKQDASRSSQDFKRGGPVEAIADFIHTVIDTLSDLCSHIIQGCSALSLTTFLSLIIVFLFFTNIYTCTRPVACHNPAHLPHTMSREKSDPNIKYHGKIDKQYISDAVENYLESIMKHRGVDGTLSRFSSDAETSKHQIYSTLQDLEAKVADLQAALLGRIEKTIEA